MTNETQFENPEMIPSGYWWMVAGIACVLATLLLFMVGGILAIFPGIAAWFCLYVGMTRNKRLKVAREAQSKYLASKSSE